MRFAAVDPSTLVDATAGTPEHGRGAWTKSGIDFDYRYRVAPSDDLIIGERAEVSLAHWAVAAGSWAVQQQLIKLGHLADRKGRRGVFDAETETAVRIFQEANVDPDGGAHLVVDGTVGRSDARALFTPVIKRKQQKYGIPQNLLLGQTNAESAMDPGAVGYYIFYGTGLEYRGVDRGFSQINSKAHPDIAWTDAFKPTFSLEYSAKRLRSTFDTYSRVYPDRSVAILWDAAVCAHNSPLNGDYWARTGVAPTQQAADYVASVRNAIF